MQRKKNMVVSLFLLSIGLIGIAVIPFEFYKTEIEACHSQAGIVPNIECATAEISSKYGSVHSTLFLIGIFYALSLPFAITIITIINLQLAQPFLFEATNSEEN